MKASRHALWVVMLGVALSQVGACGGSGGSGPLVPGRLSIPAAAFMPANGSDTYEQAGAYMVRLPYSLDAPVHLPDGATPTRFAVKYRDGGAGSVTARFGRRRFVTGPSFQLLAQLTSSDSFATANAGEVSTTTFSFSQIATDNQRYMYWVVIQTEAPPAPLPSGLPAISAIEIEYLVHETPPTVRYYGVPYPAFGPFSSLQHWQLSDGLFHQLGSPDPDGGAQYVAPVLLPDGASVLSMTFDWKMQVKGATPDPAALATVRLHRASHVDAASEPLAEATSLAVAGEGQVTVVPPSELVIDNATFAYWISADLPFPNVDFVTLHSVVLSYTAPASPTDLVALPAAAFHPSDPTMLVFENHGRILVHQGIAGTPPSPGQNGRYYAALELPDGATITGMTFFWDANTNLAGTARLERTLLSSASIQTMATASTGTGNLGNGSTFTSAVSNAVVDDALYAYWVSWDLPNYQPVYPQAVRGHSVVVEYTK